MAQILAVLAQTYTISGDFVHLTSSWTPVNSRTSEIIHSRTMRAEVNCAANFVAELMRSGCGSEQLDEATVQNFATDLCCLLMEHYQHHWHPEKPSRGSGYRCLRFNYQADPLIQRAANMAGLGSELQRLPVVLTIWVDPREVSYRIGEDGSVCNLLKRPAPSLSHNTSPTPDNWQSTSPRTPRLSSTAFSRTSPEILMESRFSPPTYRNSYEMDRYESQSPRVSFGNAGIHPDEYHHGRFGGGVRVPRDYYNRSPSPPFNNWYRTPMMV